MTWPRRYRLPPPRFPPTSEPAAQQIVRLAHSHAGRLAILATGPLTNLALALLLDPELPALVSRVTVMGGAVRVPGNTTPCAEFNIRQDPEAADLVLSARWDLTLVPLDVTMKAILTGTSQFVFIENGKLALGTWQGIFLCEFDGPRQRTVLVKIVPDPS